MKLNRKGFMLAEVIVVSVVIGVVLVTLFTSLSRMSSAYETRNRYYDIDSAYIAEEINDSLIRSGEVNTLISSGNSTVITSSSLTTFKNFYTASSVKAYFALYTSNGISNLKSKNSNNTFKDYIDYLGGNLIFNNDYLYVILVERCKTSDDCYYYTFKVRWL